MGQQQSGVHPNKRLGVPVATSVTANSNFNLTERTTVVCSYVLLPDKEVESELGKLFHIAVITGRSVELFCLLTGERRANRYTPAPGLQIKAAVHSPQSVHGNVAILAESDSVFKIIDSFTLKLLRKIGLNEHLPVFQASKSQITCMTLSAPDMLYAGYQQGVIRAWHLGAAPPQHEFNTGLELPGVRCLKYSHTHRLLFAGHEGSYENQYGRLVTSENNPIRVHTTNALEDSTQAQLLEGFVGTCFSLALVETKNFAIALSSEKSTVFIWDFITKAMVLKFELPQLNERSEIATCIGVIEMPGLSDVLLVGQSDGSSLVSQLSFNQEDLSLTWSPVKKLNSKSKKSIASEGVALINYLQYNLDLDLLLVGNGASSVSVISNFIAECLGINLYDYKEPQEVEDLDKDSTNSSQEATQKLKSEESKVSEEEL